MRDACFGDIVNIAHVTDGFLAKIIGGQGVEKYKSSAVKKHDVPMKEYDARNCRMLAKASSK